MKLVQLNKHNLPQYASILPDSILRHPGIIFISVKDDIPCGVIALEYLENQLGINWLWVAPEHRRQKIGSTLLTKAYQFALQHQYDALSIAYDPEEPWVVILEYMLARRGFHMFMSPFTRYNVTPDTLMASPLIQKNTQNKNNVPYTQPLAALSSKGLANILHKCEEKNIFFLSRCDFSKADPQKTRLYFHENDLKGLILINFTDKPKEYELALVYLHPAHTTIGPTLFREAAEQLLKDADGFSALHFTCVVDTSVRLADMFLGKCEKKVKQMCHGILEIPNITKKRRNNNGTY